MPLVVVGCSPCGRYIHSECSKNNGDECCCVQGPQEVIARAITATPKRNRPGRPPKDDRILSDPHSTWRKRATTDYPLIAEHPCEWKGLANVGGGKYPIVGCQTGIQQTIHHGPIKIDAVTDFNFNTRDEQKELLKGSNVHKICRRCHAMWHHWNDEPYNVSEYMGLLHDPHRASDELLIQWSDPKTRPTAPEPRITGPRTN